MSREKLTSVNWSFWMIVAAGLVFNILGCANFLSQMHAETVASMPDVYRAIVSHRPAWGTGAFAIAVFGGLLGCLLLLIRRAAAVYVFVVALIGTVVAQVPFLSMTGFPLAAWVGWSSQLVVATFLLWYSKRSERKGRIR